MRRWVGLVLPLWACAQGTPLDGAALAVGAAAGLEAPNAEPAEPACGMDLHVEPDWRPLVEAQAARWARATGCAVTFSPEGLPVSFVEQLSAEDDSERWGKTIVRTIGGRFAGCASVQISLAARDVEQSLAHELGHCLGAFGGIDGSGHTADGLMKPWHRPEDDTSINAEALELVCASVPCLAFNPE